MLWLVNFVCLGDEWGMLDLDLQTEVKAPPRDPSSDMLEMQLLDSKAYRVPIGLDIRKLNT